MAYLVRCPSSLCRAPKRIDLERAASGAFPWSRCPRCGLSFWSAPPTPPETIGFSSEDFSSEDW